MESGRKQTLDYQDLIIKEVESLPDKKKLFTPFEDEIIKKYYPSKGGSGLAKILHKTAKQISNRFAGLNVEK